MAPGTRAAKSPESLAWVVAAPRPTGQLESAGFLEHARPPGPGRQPADARVYPGWAGGTWMPSLVPGNLDSCPWTATKPLPSSRGWSTEHVAAARMLQVRSLVFLVFAAQLASVT